MLENLAAADELPDPSTVGPGTAAFVTFVFLVVAGILLFRSMRKQMSRVDFEETDNGSEKQSS